MNNARDHRAQQGSGLLYICTLVSINHGRTEWMLKWESSESFDVGFSKVCMFVCLYMYIYSIYGCVVHQCREMLNWGECSPADDASVFLFLFRVLMFCKPPGCIPSPAASMLGHGATLLIGKQASGGDAKEEPLLSGLVHNKLCLM